MIDATRSETDTEIINAYWRGYNDACKKMEKINDNIMEKINDNIMEKINDNIKELTTALKIVEKTLGFEMRQVKAEDVPDIIASILEKMAKRKVKVEGNGITEDIKVKVLKE